MEVSDFDVWETIDTDDAWVFDKLIVSKKLGYKCGPRGSFVPEPGWYMVRPIMNLHGMGLGARKVYLDKYTIDLNHGEFWCEFFEGEHISVDFIKGKPELTVIGEKDPLLPFQRFTKWEKIEHRFELPAILSSFSNKYPVINCEFIGEKLIEIHFRSNPDFSHGNSYMIPVWPGDNLTPPNGFRFISDDPEDDDDRVGIFVDA